VPPPLLTRRRPIRRFCSLSPRTAFVALAVAAIGVAAAGCNRSGPAPVAAKPTGSARPDINYAAVRPNELGYIPIVMYHEIGGRPVASDPGLVRSVAAFKKDLELLYDAGFRPVNLSDVLNDSIDIPAGTSPVVLTFDDGRESQFRLIDKGNAYRVDPDCALGVMQAFHERHPGWRMRATFFVLPQSERTRDIFGQAGLGAQKVDYLLGQGMEIGNHTVHHKDLSRLSAAEIQAEIGGAHNALLAIAPRATIRAVALPMGRFPRDPARLAYLTRGTFAGKTYDYQAALDASYRAVPSPAALRFNAKRLERIAPRDGRWGLRWWISALKSGSEYPRYVSDGDPNVVSFPQSEAALADLSRLKARQKLANAYGGPGIGRGVKPILGVADKEPRQPGGAADAAPPKPIVGG
jgi:peptidoglycan/xylan/chitin deacetylase (PgdA/CDA1 family)